MVHKYKKKIRCNWDKAEMIEAVKSVLEDKSSIRAACKRYGVPQSTLLRWTQKAKVDGIDSTDFRVGYFKNIFTEEQENQLKQYVKEMKLSLFKMNSIELRRIAFQFAEKNNIPHRFNKESRLAGYNWYVNFMRRQRLQEIQAADPLNNISTQDASSSCKSKTFPEMLADLYQFYKYPPNRIYNLNETASISIPSMISKIVCESDKSGLQNEFITLINCCNAAGNFVPPLMIYPASEKDPEFINGCPKGTEIACHPSGCIKSKIFYPTWFNHFVDYAKPTKEDPILLLLNVHAEHAKNLDFIKKAREINIHILNIPYKVVHPLAMNFILALKKHYLDEQNEWTEQTGLIINLKNIGQIFGRAYEKSAISSNAIDAFQATGIYPLDEEILSRTVCSLKSSTSTTKDNSDETAGPSNDQNKNSGLHIRDPGDFSFFDDLMNEENSNTSDSNEPFENVNMPLETIFVECKEDFHEIEAAKEKKKKVK